MICGPQADLYTASCAVPPWRADFRGCRRRRWWRRPRERIRLGRVVEEQEELLARWNTIKTLASDRGVEMPDQVDEAVFMAQIQQVEASVEDGSVVGVLFTGIDRENEVSA